MLRISPPRLEGGNRVVSHAVVSFALMRFRFVGPKRVQESRCQAVLQTACVAQAGLSRNQRLENR